jgi:hypothetical protein
MATDLLFRKVRAVEMYSANLRAVGGRPGVAHVNAGPDHSFELNRRTSGRRGKDCRRSVAQVRSIGDANGVGCTVHKVSARSSVYMDIHKTWRDVAVTRVDNLRLQICRFRPLDRGNLAAFHRQEATWDDRVRQHEIAVETDTAGFLHNSQVNGTPRMGDFLQ